MILLQEVLFGDYISAVFYAAMAGIVLVTCTITTIQ